MSLLESALALARQHFFIFPLIELDKDPNEKKGKTPAVKWKKWATDDPVKITDWWQRHPDCGIGIATGRNCMVLDIDNEDAYNALKDQLPKTLTARTGKGWHFYFNAIPGVGNKVNCHPTVKGVDIRGEGGFVVAPPSPHQNGSSYKWLNIAPIFDFPNELIQLLLSNGKAQNKSIDEHLNICDYPIASSKAKIYAESSLDGICSDIRNAQEGTRNDTLNRKAFMAFRLVKTGWLSENETFDRLAVAAHDCGLGQREIYVTLESAYKQASPLTQEEIDSKIGYCNQEQSRPIENDWEKRLHRKPPRKGEEKGALVADSANVAMILENDSRLKDLVRWDELTGQVVRMRKPCFDNSNFARKDPSQWTEDDDTNLDFYISDTYGIYNLNDRIRPAVKSVAQKHSYHPIREYLESCHKKWLQDKVERLRYTPADLFGADNTEQIQLSFMYWMTAAVYRVFEPGCKFDNVLILEGEQGKGKSTILSILGSPWYNDSLQNIDDKDAHMITLKNWIIEIAELGKFNRTEDTTAKNFFSQTATQIRLPYSRDVIEIQRQCVFAGTTNEKTYLKDATGNRRYWPICCAKNENINLDGLRQVRDLLWGEAVERYKNHERYVPTHEEEEQFFYPEQEERLQVDSAWAVLLKDYFDTLSGQELFNGLTNTAIFENALKYQDVSRVTRSDATRLGIEMRLAGFNTVIKKTKGVRILRYCLTKEQITERYPEKVPDLELPF